MEPFEINLVGKTYKIQLLDNGSYEVYFTSSLVGIITPTLTDFGVTWQSLSIDLELAQQIGELIEEHDM